MKKRCASLLVVSGVRVVGKGSDGWRFWEEMVIFGEACRDAKRGVLAGAGVFGEGLNMRRMFHMRWWWWWWIIAVWYDGVRRGRLQDGLGSTMTGGVKKLRRI